MAIETSSIYIKLTLDEDLLGTSPSDENIHETFIASNAPDPKAAALEEEMYLDSSQYEEKNSGPLTIFPKKDGKPFWWDYQMKGFFKDACNMLQKVSNGKDPITGKKIKANNKSSKLSAYKKVIDGLIFVYPRKIPIIMPEGSEIKREQRPLRASTPMGERIALSDAESIPADSYIVLEIKSLSPDLWDTIYEWLEYGLYRGLGQWRNSGKGRFHYEVITEEEYKEFYKNIDF